jgi:hypothetical protein
VTIRPVGSRWRDVDLVGWLDVDLVGSDVDHG